MIYRSVLFIILSVLYVTLIDLTPSQIPFDGSKDLVDLFPFLEDYYLKAHYVLFPIYGIAYGNLTYPLLVLRARKEEERKRKKELKEPVFDLSSVNQIKEKPSGKGLRVFRGKPQEEVKVPSVLQDSIEG